MRAYIRLFRLLYICCSVRYWLYGVASLCGFLARVLLNASNNVALVHLVFYLASIELTLYAF